MHDSRHRVDHDEAYRDDPAYTAPEMEPGNGEDLQPAQWVDTIHVAGIVGMAGVAGAAAAGEAIDEEVQEEIAATNPRASAPE